MKRLRKNYTWAGYNRKKEFRVKPGTYYYVRWTDSSPLELEIEAVLGTVACPGGDWSAIRAVMEDAARIAEESGVAYDSSGHSWGKGWNASGGEARFLAQGDDPAAWKTFVGRLLAACRARHQEV